MRRSVRGPRERMMEIITTTDGPHRQYFALALPAGLSKSGILRLLLHSDGKRETQMLTG